MASIERRGAKWRVRWKCPTTGRARSRSCPDKRAAKALQREVEAAACLGRDWSPPDAAPALVAELRRFLLDRRRAVSAGRFTLVDRACALLADVAAAETRLPVDEVPVSALSRDLLGAMYDHCRASKAAGGRANSALTARQRVNDALAAWTWLYDDELPGVGRPKAPSMAAAYVEHRPVYVGFDVLDLAVMHALETGRDRRYTAAMLVQRFTGLRCAQTRRLRTVDLDVEQLLLTIRPEDEKRAENGRTIPVSQHLVDELAALGLPDPSLKTLVGAEGLPWSDAVYVNVWTGCGAPPEAWAGAPSKVFRSSMVSFLTEQRVTRAAVKRLVGHIDRDVTARSYTADAALMPLMRAAVELVPGLNRARLLKRVG